MPERIALLLASLSHRWSVLVLLLPFVFVLATYGAGVLQEHARAKANYPGARIATVARRVSYGLLALSLALLGVAVLHVGCAALKAHSVQCMSNVKQIALGAFLYAQDYDERLPASTRWSEAIAPGVVNAARNLTHTNDDTFRCPSAESPASYGMNAALGGVSLSEVSAPIDTVLLFDADAPIRSFAGGASEVAWARHSHAPSVAFADGHTKSVNSFAQKQLAWTPTEASKPRLSRPYNPVQTSVTRR